MHFYVHLFECKEGSEELCEEQNVKKKKTKKNS